MALTKETVIDQIEILEYGHVQVRRATYVVEDGERTLLGYHRVAYEPGRDVSAEDPKVQRVAAFIWTPEVVAAHTARQAATALRPRTP